MSLFTPPNVRATDANSNSLSGAGWYFYLTNTSTPSPVYTTSARNVAHANPVVADSGGKFASIYLNPLVTYRAVLKTAAGSTLWDIDPLEGLSADSMVYTPAGTGAEARTIQDKLREGWVSVKDFGASGDGETDDTDDINRAIASLSSDRKSVV